MWYRHESHMTKEGYRYVFVSKTWTHVCERVFNWIFVCIRGDQIKLMHTDTSLYMNICTRAWPCKSKRCVKLCLFYSEHASQSVVLVKPCTQTRFHMSIVACRDGFVSLKVVWLYFVSGTSVGNYVTNRVSCVKSYACTRLSNLKSVQT